MGSPRCAPFCGQETQSCICEPRASPRPFARTESRPLTVRAPNEGPAPSPGSSPSRSPSLSPSPLPLLALTYPRTRHTDPAPGSTRLTRSQYPLLAPPGGPALTTSVSGLGRRGLAGSHLWLPICVSPSPIPCRLLEPQLTLSNCLSFSLPGPQQKEETGL